MRRLLPEAGRDLRDTNTMEATLNARLGLAVGLLFVSATAAMGDSLPPADPFQRYAKPDAVVAAIQTRFDAEPGQSVRISVYASEQDFLDVAAMKHGALLDDTGLAIVTLRGLAPGEYAFAAYLDEDGDGKLDRSALGLPSEPFSFSNDVVPKLRRPTFDETKVSIEPGAVVVINLDD
ncbi:MAG: DUF2141 domain-containing protein [Pseudomonadota bacterium]